jgi:cobalt-zinc-cadmium efflux system protein
MGHDHAHGAGSNERALRYALLFTAMFFVVEVAGGIWSGSLALISDAAHMFTDVAALAIALAAIRIGQRPADRSRTFGYYRFEILAAAFNALLLFGVAIYILFEAYRRLLQPSPIESTMMLIIAGIGLIVNLVSMRLLSGDKDSSLNTKGAYLEVWSDMLGSVGVILGALLIHFTGWVWVDSVIAVAIGLWVVPRTWLLLRESLNILLEGAPPEINLHEIEQAIMETPGVADVHDLHVWSISSGKTSLTVHVICTGSEPDGFELTLRLRETFAQRFGIHHTTVQLEQRPCEQAAAAHGYGPVSADAHAGHSH